jgi:Kdo2-lipid IVA lauroyltransferase/acyltransferase
MPSLAHKVEFGALRGVTRVLEKVSWSTACSIGERLGLLGYAPLGIRRKVVERQLAAAFPELSPEELKRTARSSYAHLGRTSVEAALLPGVGKLGVLDLVERVDGWEHMEAALAAGRGVVIASGHLGNWELCGAYVAARGVPLDAIARRMANPLFDSYITETRELLGMQIVHDAEAVKRTPRALREGRAVAFLADQGVLGLASTFVTFFGRPAKTPRGAAVFAIRFKAPMLFVVAIRQPSGKFRVIVEPIEIAETGDREKDVDETVARFTAALERWARLAPEQYFWQHRRWRRQPKDTPPELRDPTLDRG